MGVFNICFLTRVHDPFVLVSGPGPFPGLLDMWGGGGGLLEYRSALLASRGYVSLALEYFAPGELLTADLQLSYFEVCVIKSPPEFLPSV